MKHIVLTGYNRYITSLSLSVNDKWYTTLGYIDTGAPRTHITAVLFSQIKSAKLTSNVENIGGLVQGHKRKFIEFMPDDIKVCDVSLGNLPMLAASSDDVQATLIGMDILKKLDLRQVGNSNVLSIRETKRKEAFIVTNTSIDMFLRHILSDIDKESDFDKVFKLLPSVVDMQYSELVSLVNKYYGIK